MCVCLVAQLCPTLCNMCPTLWPTKLLCPWGWTRILGKNTGVGCHALLQEIFPTQGSNPGFSHCRQILYHLSHHCEKSSISPTNFWEIKLNKMNYVSVVTGEMAWTHGTGGSDIKESVWNVGNLGLIPGLGRSPGGGHGSPL